VTRQDGTCRPSAGHPANWQAQNARRGLLVSSGFHSGSPGAWGYSSQVTAPDGSTDLGPEPQACRSGSDIACTTALARLHFRQVVTYQPASRYWAFQCAETGLYLLRAIVLAGFCIWRVSRPGPAGRR
jgi:hypothetical protein